MSTRIISLGQALGNRARLMHEQLLERVPSVARIACLLYDSRDRYWDGCSARAR